LKTFQNITDGLFRYYPVKTIKELHGIVITPTVLEKALSHNFII